MKNVAPSKVFDVLTKFAHHKRDRVFANELAEFLGSDKDDYYFLSDDYYEHHLKCDPDGQLSLIAVSQKEEIIERTAQANAMLSSLQMS